MTLQLPAPSRLKWLAHHRFELYYRLAIAVVVINLIWLSQVTLTPELLAQGALINLSLTILIRQSYVINGLFKLATLTRTTLPLWARRYPAVLCLWPKAFGYCKPKHAKRIW